MMVMMIMVTRMIKTKILRTMMTLLITMLCLYGSTFIPRQLSQDIQNILSPIIGFDRIAFKDIEVDNINIYVSLIEI